MEGEGIEEWFYLNWTEISKSDSGALIEKICNGAFNIPYFMYAHMGVNLGRFYYGMTKYFLDVSYVRSLLKQVGGE